VRSEKEARKAKNKRGRLNTAVEIENERKRREEREKKEERRRREEGERGINTNERM